MEENNIFKFNKITPDVVNRVKTRLDNGEITIENGFQPVKSKNLGFCESKVVGFSSSKFDLLDRGNTIVFPLDSYPYAFCGNSLIKNLTTDENGKTINPAALTGKYLGSVILDGIDIKTIMSDGKNINYDALYAINLGIATGVADFMKEAVSVHKDEDCQDIITTCIETSQIVSVGLQSKLMSQIMVDSATPILPYMFGLPGAINPQVEEGNEQEELEDQGEDLYLHGQMIENPEEEYDDYEDKSNQAYRIVSQDGPCQMES